MASSLRLAASDGRLVVFADDWGRHPSSCQHLVGRMLPDCDVTWVNTIGTRPPALNLATVRRGIEKWRHWRAQAQQIEQPGETTLAPRVLSPLMWPGFRTPWQRRLNRRLLAGFLERHVPLLAEATVLTTIPIVADLIGTVKARRWVYYCVDDFSSWPGLDARALRDLEAEVVAKADLLVAAGENLADRIGRLGRRAKVITHGIDLDLWRAPVTADPALGALPHPIVLFWGLVDQRLDLRYLAALARLMTSGTIVLLGPEQAPDNALYDLPRIQRQAAVGYEALPAAAAAADVLIMPYADLPVTRAMQPLKLKEYLATGKPVVASAMPAVEAWRDCLDVASGPEEFAAAALARCLSGTPAPQQQARQRLRHESWDEKAAALRRVLFDSQEMTIEAGNHDSTRRLARA